MSYFPGKRKGEGGGGKKDGNGWRMKATKVAEREKLAERGRGEMMVGECALTRQGADGQKLE